MRWTDLPPERGPADDGASALSRGEWAELRRRLERLPPGHPSHPDGEGEERAGDGGRQAEEAGEAEESGPEPDDGQRAAGDDGQRAAGDDGRERRSGSAGHARPGGHGELAGQGGREPYRPWFAAGDSPEPWFAADPD
jgi:hypothetical protein